MNKEITYDGYSAVPSDYECSDGQLAASLNLIKEDGALRPIQPPTALFTLHAGDEKVFIHKVGGAQTNYIIVSKTNLSDTKALYWTTAAADYSYTAIATSLPDVLSVAAIGNTLAIATSEGVEYILWKDGAYKVLGKRPPFVNIEFGCYKVGTLDSTGSAKVPQSWLLSGSKIIPSELRVALDTMSETQLAQYTQGVMGLLLSEVADKVTTQGYFYQPFFVRYAYRLYDGTYYWQSAPVLMLISTIPPLVRYAGLSDSSDSDYINLSLTLDVPYHELVYRILTNSNLSSLSNWSDIVSGIDVFISTPIYTYDQSADVQTKPLTTVGDMLKSIGDWSAHLRGRGRNQGTPSNAFIGHWGDAINGNYTDNSLSVDSTDKIVNLARHSEFVRNIKECANFYKVAEIETKDIAAMSEFSALPLLFNDMSSLRERLNLTDDYRSHCSICPTTLYAFNSRLNMAGIKLIPAEPFAIRTVAAYSNPSGVKASAVTIKVWSRINGVRTYALHSGNSSVDYDTIFNYEGNFPRYIYYPESTAYKMEIKAASKTYVIDLEPHAMLNGAYYFKSDLDVDPTPQTATAETGASVEQVEMFNKLYTSEVNNPFVFLATGINTVGDGKITGIAAAVRALSQGQFGAFPLYAFSTEGVWALQVNTTGSYSAIQPICRDVCVNSDGITQLDDAVLFPSARGIMQLSGSTASCITELINSEFPFDVLYSLPAFDKIHAKMEHDADSDTCLPIKSFSEFLSGCKMIYDYTHQRIYVSNPEYKYAYVFSLKSAMWGFTYSPVIDTVNSYPEALALSVDSDGDKHLVSFSEKSEERVSGLYVTRPLKLDTPTLLKTINNIIHRGNFKTGHLSTFLYGSRDLRTWHLVWTSVNHFMRGFRGTPYKYYRIGGIASLDAEESIFGASVQYEARLTNTPR